MIRVSVEVSSGEVARFRVEVEAPSIERAVRLATVRYPGCAIRVLFPIDPQAFFLPGEPDEPSLAEGKIPIEKIAPVGGESTTVHTKRGPSRQRARRKPRIDPQTFLDHIDALPEPWSRSR
jgi:hypothetical protein